MKKSLLALALVTGCGASGEQNASAPAAAPQGTAAAVSTPAVVPAAGQAPGDTLVGLWQGGAPKQPTQLCVVRRGDTPQFGIVVWGANMRSCSGAGTLTRKGDGVTLTMTGDSACTVQARVQGGRLVVAGGVPQGCAYYCGAGAKLDGAAFSRVGASAADAAKAKDLAGDPLCG